MLYLFLGDNFWEFFYVPIYFVREALTTLCFWTFFFFSQEHWYSQKPWNIQCFPLEQRIGVLTAVGERHGASLQRKRQACLLPRKMKSLSIANWLSTIKDLCFIILGLLHCNTIYYPRGCHLALFLSFCGNWGSGYWGNMLMLLFLTLHV